MDLYTVDNDYVSYLMKFDSRVTSNIGIDYSYDRKYIGYVIQVGSYKYYIPFSSPKDSDYLMPSKAIRGNTMSIFRMVDDTLTRLYGTIKLNNMIPVPDKCLKLYDIEAELDIKYRDLIMGEMKFIKSHQHEIIRNALALYKEKTTGTSTAKYLSATVDFQLLEKMSKLWV